MTEANSILSNLKVIGAIAVIAIVGGLAVYGGTILAQNIQGTPVRSVPESIKIVHVSIVPGAATNTNLAGYSPDVITVVIGVNNTVTWTNNDSYPHTVTAVNGAFASGNMNPGASYTYTFSTPGVYNYTCSYHYWMHGEVIVKQATAA
ncbi:MAG: cupredoxin domain-containing protein [Nitrososphaerota archaeon]